MPVHTDLETRIQAAPFDEADYNRRLPHSERLANAIPLIHVDGRFESILATPPHELPTSESPNTQSAEDALGYERSVYFFAGRACPRFGTVAIAFGPHTELNHTGSVTPFDSGGMVHPKKYIKVKLHPDDDLPSRIQYGKESTIGLTDWRAVLAKILAAYFDDDHHYWTDRPSRLDPEDLYHSDNTYQAWSFEIRFYEPQSIDELIAWTSDESMMNLLRRMWDAQPVTIPGDPPTILDRVFDVPPLDPSGSATFCATMESWVTKELGL
jgi:hypothetical protein